MMRDALFLAGKDLRLMLRAKETWLWTFLMPVIFFYFIGTITKGGSPGAPDPKDPIGFYAPQDAGFLADHLARRIEAQNYVLKRAASEQEAATSARRILIPPRFTERVLDGEPQKVIFERAGSGLAADFDKVRLSRAVYTVLADLIVAHEATASGLAALSAEPRNLKLEVTSAGTRPRAPSGFEQSVPGTMVMFTLLVLFTSGAVTLAIEREQGILRRLASAPLSRGAVVLGKWMARMGLAVVQIGFAMITGSVLFGVDWGPHLVVVVLLLWLYGGLAASLGMLLGSLARTPPQVIGFGVLTTNVLAALGGCWWPIEITPLWVQKLSLLLPTGWAMDALHKLVNFGAGPATVIPHFAALALSALAAGWAASRKFRFQ